MTYKVIYIYIYIYKDFVEIYPTDLEVKVEHHGSDATFIDVDISINKVKFIYKMLDKKENFKFHIVSLCQNLSKLLGQHFYLKTFCL